LFVQALLFGQGGLSTFFTNTLAIAVVGPASAALMLRLLGANSRIGLFAAGFAGIFAAALATALLLGLQPLVASDASGAPLYFPFGFAVVLPAVLLPHLAVGALEGVITALAVPRLRARMQR
jgi:cobalt/nickel transport system permease protein